MKKKVNTDNNFVLTFANYEMLFNSKTMKRCEKFILFTIIKEQQYSYPEAMHFTEIIRFVSFSRKIVNESFKRLKAKGLINVYASIDGKIQEVEQVDERYEHLFYSLQLETLEDQNYITAAF